MKKFEPQIVAYYATITEIEMVEDPDGRYTLAEETEALEQLNKEMLEALKEALDYVGAEGGRLHPTQQTKLMSQIQSIIAKAGEV